MTTLIQFSHGILADSSDVSRRLTSAHQDHDPHPDDLKNPMAEEKPIPAEEEQSKVVETKVKAKE